MSHDPVYVAGTIANWADLPGVKLSKELTEKLDRLSALQSAESYVPVPSMDKLTTDNADELVAAYAQELATQGQFADAKMRLRTVLVSQVLDAARAEIPKAIEQMTPTFDAAVETYVGAVTKLPEELSSDALVAAGPEALAAYHEAAGAAAMLATVDSWVASLHNLCGGGVPDKSVRVLAPRDHRELGKLDAARKSARHDGTANLLVPVFLAAARLEVPFEIHTPGEAQAVRAGIEAQAAEEAPRIHGQW